MNRRVLKSNRNRKGRRGWSVLAAAVLALPLAAVTTTGCDDGEAAPACAIATERDDCGARGLICGDGACIERQCTTSGDCGQQRACFEGTCTPVECSRDSDCAAGAMCIERVCRDSSTSTTCTVDADCAQLGQICNPITQMCVADTPDGCASDTDCTAPQRCHVPSGECVSGCVQDSDCTDVTDYCDAVTGNCTEGCREGGCSEGQSCDLETRTCVGSCTISDCAALGQACDPDSGTCVPRDGKTICETCTPNSDECGGPGDRCHSIGGNFVCTYACDSGNGDTDCPSGFRCQMLTSSVSGCVPDSGMCTGCLVSGCTAGEVCDPEGGMCQTQVETCKVCAANFECGQGAGCIDYQGRDRCLDRCATDGTCPTGYNCNMNSGFCEPGTGSCTTCTVDPSTCTNQQVLDEDRCACVECVTNDDCNGNQVCAQGTGECIAGMGSCTGPADCNMGVCYGANAMGPGVCVGCITSADCSAGSYCDSAQTCQSCNCPTGEVCQPDGTCSNPNVCTSDQDCIDSRGADYRCDSNSGLCFIPGECDPGDPTVAPCPSGQCGGGMFPLPLCSCTVAQQNCRSGESCFPSDPFGDPTGPGTCFPN